MFWNNSFYIASHVAAIRFLFWTSSLFFFFFFFFLDFFTYQIDFFLPQPLNLLPFSYQLSVRFWKFHVLFWMLWILGTAQKSCHVPHAPQITAWEKILNEICFDVPEEWVRSWSHVFVITKVKTLPRSFWKFALK